MAVHIVVYPVRLLVVLLVYRTRKQTGLVVRVLKLLRFGLGLFTTLGARVATYNSWISTLSGQ